VDRAREKRSERSVQRSLTFLSPAKLNLFFRILGKRSDGYHEIASIFQAINLFDTLTIKVSSEDQFTCSDSNIATSDNLVVKALNLFREKTNILDKVSIHLEKHIPIGAGLGGGSSNVATCLWALKTLFDSSLKVSTLMDWGAEIGSDVPFFFASGAAVCKGRGEKVEDIALPDFKGYVISPNMHVSTISVYHNVDMKQVSDIPVETLIRSFKSREPIFINDLEHAAFQVEPSLKEIKSNYHLTGSGSCFFSLKAPKNLPSSCKLFPVKSVTRSHTTWYCQ